MVPPYNKDTELGTREQEVFLASKMTRGYLEPKKPVSKAISNGVFILKFPLNL